jgi:hypothetical protein
MTDDRAGADGYVLHDSPPSPRSLVPPERDVRTGRRVDLDRSDKGRNDVVRHGWRRRPRVFAVTGAAALVVLATGGALIVAAGSDSQSESESAEASATTPPSTTAAPSTVASTSTSTSSTSTSTSSSSSTSTTVAALDPDDVTHLAVVATWTRVEGNAPPGVVVGGSQEFDIPCEDGVCDLSFGWLLELGEPTMNFVAVQPDEEDSVTLCDPLTLSLVGELQDDGSYLGEFQSEPAQYEAPGCSFFGVTQTITFVPSVG